MGLNVHVMCKEICNRADLVIKGSTSCASVNTYIYEITYSLLGDVNCEV